MEGKHFLFVLLVEISREATIVEACNNSKSRVVRLNYLDGSGIYGTIIVCMGTKITNSKCPINTSSPL